MRETWVLLLRTDLHCIASHLKYMQVARILWITQVQCFSHMTQCWFWEQTRQQFDLNLTIEMKDLMIIQGEVPSLQNVHPVNVPNLVKINNHQDVSSWSYLASRGPWWLQYSIDCF